jgi:NmrA-like family
MAQQKLAAILGATRGQGLSVLNALLKTNRYRIRGVTTDPDTPEADQLRARGINLIGVNLDDPDSVSAAFADARVLFAVTTMYDGDMEREIAQGMNIAKFAAGLEGLEHFVWSTLPSASTVSGGRIAVPHMDGKARVDEYILQSLPALAAKTTFYWGGFYAENVLYPNFCPNLLESAGKYVWIQPVGEGTLVPMVGDHTVNTGIFVRRLLERPDVCLPGGYVLGAVDWMANGELLRAWAKVLGEKEGRSLKTVYVHSDVDTVDQLWPGIGKELGKMLKLLEALRKEAWTKDGVKVLTMQDLGLKVGVGDDDLVSTERALKKLGSKL